MASCDFPQGEKRQWTRVATGRHSLQAAAEPAGPAHVLYIYSCGAAHTFVLPFRIEQRALFSFAASSSGNKSGHLKKG